MNCQCYCVSDIKVPMSQQNPNRLYYSCKQHKCKWVGWCEPIEDDADGKNRVQTNDPYGDARMGILEDEVKKLEKLVEGLTEAIQEEVATVKFEFDNGSIAMNKDVDDKLSVLKKDFDKEHLALKPKLKEMKKTNGNLKYGIIGFMFVMVLVFISNHI
ncbi:hypothetical protein A2U01_0004647 [Trifolium medium]|uniref:Uncharacterized protein n=1 Tax=Trifolium medium TaxID=97028 RepID=A0A392M966_9FABA|nr:hypothetical protein [Trifolium medium]